MGRLQRHHPIQIAGPVRVSGCGRTNIGDARTLLTPFDPLEAAARHARCLGGGSPPPMAQEDQPPDSRPPNRSVASPPRQPRTSACSPFNSSRRWRCCGTHASAPHRGPGRPRQDDPGRRSSRSCPPTSRRSARSSFAGGSPRAWQQELDRTVRLEGRWPIHGLASGADSGPAVGRQPVVTARHLHRFARPGEASRSTPRAGGCLLGSDGRG